MTATSIPARQRLHRPTLRVCFLFAVDTVAAIILLTEVFRTALVGSDFSRFALLMALAFSYDLSSRRLERRRQAYREGGIWSNHRSVWEAAAILSLSIGLVAALTAALYVVSVVSAARKRSWRRVYRVIFSAATAMIAAVCSREVYLTLHGYPSAGPEASLAIVVALTTFTTLSLVLIMIGSYLADRPARLRMLLPNGRALLNEITALTLGLVAVFVVVGLPWLSPALLLLVVAADRSTLVRDLQRAASTDVKTGLMTMRAWADQVGRDVSQLRKRRATGAILMIDLDHFKHINDTYGHLTGDQVLGATAQALSNELRSKDVIGRFGGEEFVVFLDETCYRDAELIADRLRRSVRRLHELNLIPCAVSASIGVALSPRNGYGLPELMQAADAAVFEAKRAGRDTVVMARRPVGGSAGAGSAGVGSASANPAVSRSGAEESLWSTPAPLGEPGGQ